MASWRLLCWSIIIWLAIGTPAGAVDPARFTEARYFTQALSLSTEWEAASQTQPLLDWSRKANNILVKQGGLRRKIREIA